MEQDIETLKEIIDEYKSCAVFGLDMQVDVTFREKQCNALEQLLKAYKELEEKWNKDTHKLQNALDMANADKINNYIPVSLVEEIKNELHDNYINSNGDNFLKLEHQLEILEKLLEKRE